MKKNLLILCFMAVLAIILTSCGEFGQTNSDQHYTTFTVRQIAEIIIDAQENITAPHYLTPSYDFWEYLFSIYRLDITEDELIDGVIFYAGGVIADEIAVFLFADTVNIANVRDALAAYIERRIDIFAGYAPLQAALLSNSIVSVHGHYVALLITEDARSAEAMFLACFSDNPPSLPQMSVIPSAPANGSTDTKQSAETSDIKGSHTPSDSIIAETPYTTTTDLGATTEVHTDTTDTRTSLETPIVEPFTGEDGFNLDSIVLAWRTGDTSALTPMNLRIFNKCIDVINALIFENMDDFEKQIAIHDWIIFWANYDPGALSNRPVGDPNPNNDNPYGLLFDQVAICTGFSYTFQLFMNLLGFECITVHGYSFRNKEHAWNLVKIGNEWFAVDVTWNNPVGGRLTHRHFNLTSQYLWDTIGHRWDRDSVPEATGVWQRGRR